MAKSENASQIIGLAEEIVGIARKINHEDNFLDANLIRKSEYIVKINTKRDKEFEGNTFLSDPCWDILLHLFLSHLKGQNISVKGAGLAANVPEATARRWMNILEEAGLIERKGDPSDGSRSFVQVTDDAIDKLTRVLK